MQADADATGTVVNKGKCEIDKLSEDMVTTSPRGSN